MQQLDIKVDGYQMMMTYVKVIVMLEELMEGEKVDGTIKQKYEEYINRIESETKLNTISSQHKQKVIEILKQILEMEEMNGIFFRSCLLKYQYIRIYKMVETWNGQMQNKTISDEDMVYY